MSAVVKDEKIETVFDHGISEAEMINLFGFVEAREIYNDRLSNDFALGDLYLLYHMRGDEKSANAFLNKMSSAAAKADITRAGCCDNPVCSQLLRENPNNILYASN